MKISYAARVKEYQSGAAFSSRSNRSSSSSSGYCAMPAELRVFITSYMPRLSELINELGSFLSSPESCLFRPESNYLAPIVLIFFIMARLISESYMAASASSLGVFAKMSLFYFSKWLNLDYDIVTELVVRGISSKFAMERSPRWWPYSIVGCILRWNSRPSAGF